ncbi:MAG: glycerol-3-phosphate dehydrogenase [Gemmatimonadaceae bacterium]|jgi:glycerol-3-phosphate dehydrogenase|nr:glycerol-3-phosphate dehydrogenase [Gemmatimonadaceae bacterium]
MMLVVREGRYPNLAVKLLIIGLIARHFRYQKRMTAPFGEQFDLLVIGGGITGCGVARDAAMRGLRVALFEANDFASGTSGRSSRLVHGGIRYLERAQLHLVHESIRERQTLLRIAPHIVKPLAFTWPLYRGARVGRLKLSAGLLVYQLMALGRSRRHFTLNAAETIAREPALEGTGLTGGAVYYDACTDDARLTVVNALSARDNGATIANHTRVTGLLRENGKVTGAIVKPRYAGEAYGVRSRVIVNATGVWENGFMVDERAQHRRGSKGVHISVPKERIGNHDALTLISPIDGRVMFCLPAGPQTIIGTTDTWTDESPETVHASLDDVDYLLRSANTYFPRARLTRDDVVSAWAGIRPLARAASTNPSAVSREHSIVTDSSSVISVTGGKLTTYRSMAAEVVDLVQKSLGHNRQRAPTDSTELPGADRERAIARLQREDNALSMPLVGGLPYTGAHLVYGVTVEMAQTLSDLLIRRTHLAFETRDHGSRVAPHAAGIVAPLLGWNEETTSARVREYERDVERMFAIGSV